MAAMNDEPAKLEYYSSDYHVVKPGSYVLCAVTGQRIPIDELRYWSAELQEAYASAEISFARHREVQEGAA
jgi:hypothetical protein